jgi:hypothetical protein
MRKRVGTCLGVPLKQDNQGHPASVPISAAISNNRIACIQCF